MRRGGNPSGMGNSAHGEVLSSTCPIPRWSSEWKGEGALEFGYAGAEVVEVERSGARQCGLEEWKNEIRVATVPPLGNA